MQDKYKERTRQEIIHDNFFYYLKKSGKTMSEYAKDNNLDRTTLSKWKSLSSNMNNEHIFQAAKYFGVVVNDLYYNQKEKKNLEVLTDNNYKTVLAQQSIKINNYKTLFNKPLNAIFGIMMLFIGISSFIYLVVNLSYIYLLFYFVFSIASSYVIHSYGIKEKTYIINYTDDIYYLRKDHTNKYKFMNIGFIIMNIIITLINVLFIELDNQFQLLISVYGLVLIFVLFINIFSLINYPYKFKLTTKDSFEGYNMSLYRLISILVLFGLTINLSLNFNIASIVSVLLGSIQVILVVIDYYVLSKLYSKYELVYSKDQKVIEYL